MELKKGLFLFTSTLFGIFSISVAVCQPKMTNAKTYTSYSCASVHFGMNDDTHKAQTYKMGSGTNTTNSKNCKVNGITLTSGNGTNILLNSSKVRPVQLGDGDFGGSFVLNFNETIIGLTIYAYSTTMKTLKVNGNNIDLETHNLTLGLGGATLEYEPHYLDLDNTSKITITFSKGICYIADISFRII